MSATIDIGGRRVGGDRPAYVIAEIGVNHDGSLSRALELVDAAADAGADAIKLQLFEAERLLSSAARVARYQAAVGERDVGAMLGRLELPVGDMARCVDRAHARSVHALVTVFSTDLVERALGVAFDGFKSASPDVIHRPLLESMAASGRPLVVSTGAATLDECARAAGWLASYPSIAFLHCVSAYPTPLGEASLRGMEGLRGSVGDRVIGYSDHTTREDTGAIAVACGARVLEKHLSHDRAASGPDHAASLDPGGFARYVAHVRDAESMLGVWPKACRPVESDVRSASRQSVCTVRAVAAGERLERADLTIKRPGVGIEPWRIDELVGRCATRDLGADAPVVAGDVEGVA